MFCPKCGTKQEDGTHACSVCGTPQVIKNSDDFRDNSASHSALTQNPQAESSQAVTGHSSHGGSSRATATHVLTSLEDRLNRLAGTEKLEGFSVIEMFSEVFKRRSDEELDDYFIAGTMKTTPRIEDVQTGWPKPWFFFRVLLFMLIICVGFDYSWRLFQNTNDVPGYLMMASLAVPLATVFLFFELNTPRNVSFAKVLMLVGIGSIVSFLITGIADSLSGDLAWMGNSVAGLIEESAKLLAVVVLARQTKFKYILNGLLFGAAIGAGFSAFETAGYGFNRGYVDQLISSLIHGSSHATVDAVNHMIAILEVRGFLSPFGHIPWTAIAAGALWRLKGDREFEVRMFLDPRFLRVFSIPVVLHMIWDLPWENKIWTVFWSEPPAWPTYLVYLVIGLIGWIVVLGLVQQGLHQVREEQIVHTKTMLEQVKAKPDVGESVLRRLGSQS